MGTATRTVVFTDLANYTAKVSRTDREGLRRILLEHEALVQPIVEQYGGRIVKNLGDSFLCLFKAATDALRAALDIQHLVTEEGEISIRLAMTTGDVEEIDGDAFGESVNLAARILSKAPAGEIWFSSGTQMCMNQAEIPWESVGRFRMKGIPGDREIFRAVPRHRAWLPDGVAAAARMGSLVRVRRGQHPGMLPPEPTILLEDFSPGSDELGSAIDSLPVINPASIFLSTYNIAESDRLAWVEQGRGMVIGTPAAVDAAIQDTLRVVSRTTGSDTIVLDVGVDADLELYICGLALPAVPLHDVVARYAYDLLPDGRWVNRSDRAIVRVEVKPDSVQLHALYPGVASGGRSVGVGNRVPLTSGVSVQTPVGLLRFLSSDNGYAGILLLDTEMRLGVSKGQTAELGREPNHPGLAFPDRRGQDNIQWCPGSRAARARAGGFTLDRALAGRRQVSVEPRDDDVMVAPLHSRCPTFACDPEGHLERVQQRRPMDPTHLIVAGTTVVGLRRPEN